MHNLASVIVALSLVSFPVAQRTWVVDAAGGVGSNFADLPPALAAARPGDTVLVRAGLYSPSVVNKAIKLVGDAGATLGRGFGVYSLSIRGIPAGSHCAVSGFSLVPMRGAVLVADNRGAVVLDSIDGRGTWMLINNCDHVSLNSVASRVACFWSTISVQSSIQVLSAGVIGIQAHQSRVFVSRSTIVGGTAMPGSSTSRAAAAIQVRGGELVVGPRCVLRAGARFTQGSAPGVFLDSASARIDPLATITGSGEPGIKATGSAVQMVAVTSLAVTNAAVGGRLVIELQSTSHTSVIVSASLPTTVRTSPFGLLALDTSSVGVFGIDNTDSSGRWQSQVVIPAVIGLRGESVVFQALALTPLGLELSTPATGTVR